MSGQTCCGSFRVQGFLSEGINNAFFLKNDIFETKLLFLCGDARSRPVGRFGSSRRVTGMRQTRDGSTRDPTGRARRLVRIVRRTWPTVDAWRTSRSKGDNRVAGRWPLVCGQRAARGRWDHDGTIAWRVMVNSEGGQSRGQRAVERVPHHVAKQATHAILQRHRVVCARE